jgi:hypothetical protein
MKHRSLPGTLQDTGVDGVKFDAMLAQAVIDKNDIICPAAGTW